MPRNGMDELIHKGHRQRMRAKLNNHGARVFDTYELLEMLLYRTAPQRDTNPVAKRLLMRFGSLDGVLCATAEELCEVEGVGRRTAELIVSTGMAFDIVRSEGETGRVFLDHAELGRYFVDMLGAEEKCQVVMMLLDNSMRMICCNRMYELDYASGGVKPSPFLDLAVKTGAAVAVIAHNHPYGPLCATEGDRQTGILINNALHGIGVTLAEHYVICGNAYVGTVGRVASCSLEQRGALEIFWRSMGGRGDEM